MQSKRIRNIFVLFLMLVAPVTFMTSQAHAAGSASLTLSPNSGSYAKDSTITVTISENSGTQEINLASVHLLYDSAVLQYSSVDASTSAFNFDVEATGGSGLVSVTRAVSGGGSVSGTKTVAKVNFKVLKDSGSSKITIQNSTEILTKPTDLAPEPENIWNGETTGGSFTFTTPASGGSSSGSSKTTNTTPVSTAVKTSAKPIADNEPIPVVTPERIDANKTYLVDIEVQDESHNKLEGVEVLLGTNKATTDKKGVAGFTSVSAGEYKVQVNGASKTIKVNEGDTAALQAFSIVVKPRSKITKYILYASVALALVALVVLSLIFGRRFLNNKSKGNTSGVHNPAPPVSPDDIGPILTSAPKSTNNTTDQDDPTVIDPTVPPKS